MEYGGHDSRSYSWGTGETWCRVGASVSQTNSTSAYISFEGGVTSGNSSTGGGTDHRLSGYDVTCTVSTSSGGSSSASASYNYANWVAITSGGVWVSRTHNNYSVTITCSYSSYNGASNSGSVSTSVTIPKKDSHTITFNDNGGSGGPGSYTKWPGEDLVIPSTKPTRENYRFEGWSTSSTATSATYLAGTTYTGTDDKSYTLYAVWTLLYKAPTVIFVEAHRVDSATATDESALGTYMRAQFNWSVDTVIYPENTVKTIAATAVLSDSSTPTCTISGTITGTSGTIYIVAPIATNLSGIISVIVTDSIKEGTGTANGSVGIGHIPFEVANGGTSIGILNSAGDANSITLGGLRLTDVHEDDLVTIPLKQLRWVVDASENRNPHNGWVYNKYNDGTAECWYQPITQITQSDGWENGWYHNKNGTSGTFNSYKYPFTWAYRPCVYRWVIGANKETDGNAVAVFPYTYGDENYTGSVFYGSNGYTTTPHDYYDCVYVFGIWKSV